MSDEQVVQAEEREMVEHLSDEDLQTMKKIGADKATAVLKAEKAAAEAECARLGEQNAILTLYLKYNLTAKDTINRDNGLITRNKAK